MGLLSFLSRTNGITLMRLPAGSFTLDRDGRVLASTLPQTFPAALMTEIGQQVLAAFRLAKATHLPLSELVAEYSSLKLTARELRGGAIIFLSPRGLGAK